MFLFFYLLLFLAFFRGVWGVSLSLSQYIYIYICMYFGAVSVGLILTRLTLTTLMCIYIHIFSFCIYVFCYCLLFPFMKMYVAFLFLLWFAVAVVGGKKHSRHLNFTSFHILTNAAFTFFFDILFCYHQYYTHLFRSILHEGATFQGPIENEMIRFWCISY